MQEGREDATARPSLVGVGVLSLQMCGNGSDSTARKLSLIHISARMPAP